MTTQDHGAPDWLALARAIVERRTALRLTQAEAAELGGVSDQTFSLLERAERTSYRARTLRGVCKALGWTTDSIDRVLAGGDPTMTESPDDHLTPPTALREVVEMAGGHDLTPEEQAKVEAFVQGLLAAREPS